MLAIKGFITSALFVDNGVGEVAKIGELSPEALTYSRDKGQYTSPAVDNLALVSFLSKLDDVKVSITQDVVDNILTVSQFVFNKTLTESYEIFPDQLLQSLTNTFVTVAEDFSCGEIITDGEYYMPEWLAWKIKDNDLGENEIRVWFIDESFRLQYDDFEIVVVPPTDNLDNFFKTGTEVGIMLTSLSTTQIIQRMQAAKSGHPETILRSEDYDYLDPYNPEHIVPSNWGLLIYGAAGNNIDAISDALVTFILANSTHTRLEWTTLLPDLFKRTEFILIPSWYQYAIPNREIQKGIYSPAMGLSATLAYLKELVPAYPALHIDDYATTMGHPYMSLSINAIGGPDNRDGLFKITDVFPDYISVSTQSQDFNRMSLATKDWLNTLAAQLIVSEKISEFSSIQTTIPMTKTKRNGILYTVVNFGNINFLMATKSNFATP